MKFAVKPDFSTRQGWGVMNAKFSTPDQFAKGPVLPFSEGAPVNGAWEYATTYKGYQIDVRPNKNEGDSQSWSVRVGGSQQVAAQITFKTREGAIGYGREICDFWETGTPPSAPTGSNIADDGTIRNGRFLILNGGPGSGPHPDASHIRNVQQVAKERGLNLDDAAAKKHASIILSQREHDDDGDDKYGQNFHDAVKQYFTNSAQTMQTIQNAGTKEGFKKGQETRSATGAKNNADSAEHYKKEAQKHASGQFAKGHKPDLEKAGKAAMLATGCAVVADASAKQADVPVAYDHAIRAHQAAAAAHKAARGDAKADHESPHRKKEAAHLKSVDELKGLKDTVTKS